VGILLCVTAALSFVGFALGSGRAGRAIGWFALAAALGCGLVWARTSWVELPKFEHPAVTEVSGRIESVDHLAARDRLRLDPDTLSQGGGLAIYLSNEPRVDTVADRVGHHPWAEIAR
jgi:competence protein ComEC